MAVNSFALALRPQHVLDDGALGKFRVECVEFCGYRGYDDLSKGKSRGRGRFVEPFFQRVGYAGRQHEPRLGRGGG